MIDVVKLLVGEVRIKFIKVFRHFQLLAKRQKVINSQEVCKLPVVSS